MKIEYLGHSCFALTFKNGTKIITDPYTKVGYELPENLTADIVTVSHGHFDHSFISAIGGNPVIVSDKDGYENADIRIVGIDSWHDDKQGALRGKNVIYKIFADGMKLCHLGDLGEPCADALVQKIGSVDVLLIPIGGTYTIDAGQAKTYIEKLAPKTVVPMHYKSKDCTLDIADEKAFLDLFHKEGVEVCKGERILSKEEITANQRKILFMERR